MRYRFLCGCLGLLLSIASTDTVDAQEEAVAPSASSARELRTGYRALKLESLPRDENGQLTVAVWDIIATEAEANPKSNEATLLKERPIYQEYYKKFAGWKAVEPPSPPAGKLRTLSEIPKAPRFPLTGKVWPARLGEASVCLWEDDKLAAISFGVDDNNAMDIPYWKDLSAKHGGLNITWNLITSNIGGVVSKGRISQAGTWETWNQMLAEGYRVASHSTMHNHCPVPADGWPGPEWEVAQSKYDLEANLPGQKIRLFVYPGAGVRVFGTPRDPKTVQSVWRPYVEKHFAAARVGGGKAINPANMIDYQGILSTTGSVPHLLGSDDPRFADQNLNKLFDPDPNNKNYRGWANVFIHFINNGKDFDANPFNVAYEKILAFSNEHRADLWIGFTEDVALYGQERDTATLETKEATETRIVFSLTSKMDPAIFDFPLTIKVRVPDNWKNPKATQVGASIPAQVIQNEGKSYVLVKALPDKGAVTLVP